MKAARALYGKSTPYVTTLSQELICRTSQKVANIVIERVIKCNTESERKVKTNQFIQGPVGHYNTMGFCSMYNGKPVLITLIDQSDICVAKINLADSWKMDCSRKSHTGN